VPTTTITFSTGANVAGSGVDWTDPTNALASDNSHATAILSGVAPNTDQLRITNGDFSAIPITARIDTVTVAIEAKYAGGASGAKITSAQLVRTGAVIGAIDTTDNALTLTDATNTYTGTNAVWGTGHIQRASLDSTFGVQLACARTSGDPTVSVDFVSMDITWQRVSGKSRSRKSSRRR